MKFLPLIWAGLWRKRSRTILTLLSIVIAFLLYGMLQGVNAAFSQSIAGANVNRLYVNNKINFTESLPYAYLPQLESVPGVSRVAFMSWFGTYYQDKKNQVFSFPVDPERYFDLYPELKIPKDQLDALIHTRTGAVIGAELAKKYGWKIGDQISLHSMIWTKLDGGSDWPFDIVGIFDNPSDSAKANSFLFNHTYFDEARSFGKGKVGWFVLRISDPQQAATVAKEIDRRFANSADETHTQTEKESSQSFLKQIGDINFIVNAITNAVFFTLLFLTGNTMMQSIRERIPELAILKTLGFSDTGVLALIFAEALLLCEIAALVGLGIAAALFPTMRGVIGVATLPPQVIVEGLVAALVLALLTGLAPAWRAKRLQIVDALAGR